MAAKDPLSLTLTSPEDTADLAGKIAAILGPGDVILLSGPIGAGKSHFARSLIQAHQTANGQPPEDVPSPTFTLVQTYLSGPTEIWHADLYRLSLVDEIEELGLVDAFDTALCLVEWPDRMGDLAPDRAMHFRFDPGEADDARRLVASNLSVPVAEIIRKAGGTDAS